ncbi:MAG: PhzF family phenazine biosynthesis protein [Saprospiraceae bacterium]
MKKALKIYQIDAFTDKVFGGNPAAVCILEEWLSDEVMQKIAAENNLAETAFAVKVDEIYELRWFTPLVEVALCGHATLAAAHVLFHHYNHPSTVIQFSSRFSGLLEVNKNGEELTLDFPSDEVMEVDAPIDLIKGMNIIPSEVHKGKTDYLLIYDSQEEIEQLSPNIRILKQVDARGIIASAKGDDVDFVSRFFGPQVGVDEDPVTGSAHTTLIPFWSRQLDKNQLSAMQLSRRQGYLTCEYLGERVKISGKAITYLQGEIYL